MQSSKQEKIEAKFTSSTEGFSTFLCSSLNLDSCQGEITDAGIQCLVSCYQLSSLVVSYLEKVGTL